MLGIVSDAAALTARLIPAQSVRLWDPDKLVSLAVLMDHENAVTSFADLGNGLLLSGSWDTTLRVYDTTRMRALSKTNAHFGKAREEKNCLAPLYSRADLA